MTDAHPTSCRIGLAWSGRDGNVICTLNAHVSEDVITTIPDARTVRLVDMAFCRVIEDPGEGLMTEDVRELPPSTRNEVQYLFGKSMLVPNTAVSHGVVMFTAPPSVLFTNYVLNESQVAPREEG